MTIEWIIIAVLLGVLLGQSIRANNKTYSFYLTDCYNGTQIIILAHHFKHKIGHYVFYDGWGHVVFYSNISWTNVYRGREV